VLGLPGNPVSSMVSAMIFLRPLIDQLAGPRSSSRCCRWMRPVLAVDLPENGPRAHFMRAMRNTTGHCARFRSQDSSLLRLLGNADALIYRPAHAPAASAGSVCAMLSLPS
jgi:molybdopterin molybdotransferase